MPRTARIDIPNILQHVIVRGIEKRDIFTDDDDRRDFVRRFSSLLESTGTECLAWALMSNHFHLLLRTKDIPLAKFMRRLLTGYAVAFNLRHNRSGHLFQNRYKSIVCNEEEYLLELVRYIHLNPLRAGLVSTLDELDSYPWCGHSVLLTRNEMPGQTTAEVLSRFGRSGSFARRHYRSFIQDGMQMGRRGELVGLGVRRNQAPDHDGSELRDSRVLGDGDFVEQILRHAEMELPKSTISLDRIIESVLTSMDVTHAELMSRTRALRVANARSIICSLAYACGHRGVDIAARLNISGPGVSVAARRGKEIIGDHPELLALVKRGCW
jgi:REP element-mobilizing transposase RayT